MKQDSFKDFVLDQMSDLREVTCRPMFGGYGVYQCEVFFGIIHQGRLYFKTNDRTRPAYVKKGMKPLLSKTSFNQDTSGSNPLRYQWLTRG